MGELLPHRSLGYSSVIEFMDAMPHIVAIEKQGSKDWLLYDSRTHPRSSSGMLSISMYYCARLYKKLIASHENIETPTPFMYYVLCSNYHATSVLFCTFNALYTGNACVFKGKNAKSNKNLNTNN